MQITPQNQTPVYNRYLRRSWDQAEYNCWSLVREVYADELGVTLDAPELKIFTPRAIVREFRLNPARRMFVEVSEPKHLDVALYKSQHVGVFLETPEGPRILHNDRGTGVACIPVSEYPSPVTYWRPNYV